MDDRLFNFEKLIADMPNVANRIDRIIGNYKPEQRRNMKTKKEDSLAF